MVIRAHSFSWASEWPQNVLFSTYWALVILQCVGHLPNILRNIWQKFRHFQIVWIKWNLTFKLKLENPYWLGYIYIYFLKAIQLRSKLREVEREKGFSLVLAKLCWNPRPLSMLDRCKALLTLNCKTLSNVTKQRKLSYLWRLKITYAFECCSNGVIIFNIWTISPVYIGIGGHIF